ncbi:MAG: DUF4397 domain-containing protein [Myxococcales bacterium]|nr:MAG: DUF4397 domain-containing protein [Myxococcales bacterium]
MNNSNIRFLSFASLSLLLGLAPLACGSDDDTDNPGTAGKGGTSSTAGKSNSGGDDNGGTSNGGTSNGGTSNGGSLNVGGDASGGVSGGEGGVGGEGAVAKSRLRVVHASPNAPAVDVYVKGSSAVAVENVAYGKATEFLEVDAGTIAFDLRAAGAEATEDAAFTSEDITLEAGEDYTLVAAGDFVNTEDADVKFRILPLQHDFDAAEAGTALARVVHATSAWEDVNLDLASTNAVDLPGLDRFASESNVALSTAATEDIAFTNADDEVVSQLVLPKLASKSEVFVIATGNPGFPFRAPANGFALLVVDQDGNTSWVKENPWIHVLHSSDVGTVDIYQSTAATTKLADDLEQGALAAFQLKASTAGYTLKAVDSEAVNGSITSDAQGTTSTLLVGEHYLSYLAGDQIRTLREQFDLTQTDKVLLRGVHALKTGAIGAQIDFGPLNEAGTALASALIEGVGPGLASAPAGEALEPGAVTLGATATGTTTPIYNTLALTATTAPVAGERDFLLLTGTGATVPTTKLYVVDTSVAGWAVR